MTNARYATRVVYMHDGAIIHDEQTPLGEVAATAKKIMFTVPTKTEEDDLAGVSILMKSVPDASDTEAHHAEKAQKPAAKKRKSSKPRAKRTTGAKK